jgi:predicted O-methyltransferase YrrM
VTYNGRTQRETRPPLGRGRRLYRRPPPRLRRETRGDPRRQRGGGPAGHRRLARPGPDAPPVRPHDGRTAHLEVGTLGGYSTIELARALPADGRLVTLEIDPHHAEVARANLARAGLAERVEVVTGPAADTLRALDGPFDLIFIDADKPSNVVYLDEALRLSRPGTTIIIDNVIREGGVLDADSGDDRIQGTRALFDAVHAEPRLTATAVQTVGVKKWDGVLLAVVNG